MSPPQFHPSTAYAKTRSTANPADRKPTWIDVQGVSDGELGELSTSFRLHPLTLEDCIAEDTREKLDTQNVLFTFVVSSLLMHLLRDITFW